MPPLSATSLQGIWGTVLLPLDKQERIRWSDLEAQVEAMIAAGLGGVYTNGTAGEFHTQSEEEFDQLSEKVARLCRKAGAPFQLGASHMSAQVSRERLKRAKVLGPGALQIILPDWLPLNGEETERFLKTMAEEAAPVPLVLYMPAHAKRSLDAAALGRLCGKIPQIIGLKIPDGNASWYAALRRNLGNVSVFIPGHHVATGCIGGARGSYSNVACLSPTGAQKWYQQIFTDPPGALVLERKILDFFGAHISKLAAEGFSPVAIDKALAAAGGWCPFESRVRWPYSFVPRDRVASIREHAREDLPELWE